MRVESIKLMPVGSRITSENTSQVTDSDKSFGQFLSEALDNVNKLQNDAKQASVNLAAGKVDDISQVVVATEKASIALQLTMQVRNKVVEAYQEVMRMQM